MKGGKEGVAFPYQFVCDDLIREAVCWDDFNQPIVPVITMSHQNVHTSA